MLTALYFFCTRVQWNWFLYSSSQYFDIISIGRVAVSNNVLSHATAYISSSFVMFTIFYFVWCSNDMLTFIVKEDTLLDMVTYMTEDVGLVHQMPFTCDREGFAATLEKVCKKYSFCFTLHLGLQVSIFILAIYSLNNLFKEKYFSFITLIKAINWYLKYKDKITR